MEEDQEVANAVAMFQKSSNARPANVQPVLGAGLSFNLSGCVGNGIQDFREQ